MSQLIESLKRLYKNGRISKEKLLQMISEGKITKVDFKYIIG